MDTAVIIAIGTQTIAGGVALFKMWTDIQIKIKELDMRVTQGEHTDHGVQTTLNRVEKFMHEMERSMHESNTRVERMINEVRLELRDKMDRP